MDWALLHFVTDVVGDALVPIGGYIIARTNSFSGMAVIMIGIVISCWGAFAL